ncbi:hypothetical protein GOODEAATRI_031125, partial [Goodea atripinnis]
LRKRDVHDPWCHFLGCHFSTVVSSRAVLWQVRSICLGWRRLLHVGPSGRRSRVIRGIMCSSAVFHPCHPSGWDTVTAVFEDLSSARLLEGNALTRQEELCGGLPVLPEAAHSGMKDVSSGGTADLGSVWQGPDGSLCLTVLCSLQDILQYLQWLFDVERVASTLKVHLAAFSVNHVMLTASRWGHITG